MARPVCASPQRLQPPQARRVCHAWAAKFKALDPYPTLTASKLSLHRPSPPPAVEGSQLSRAHAIGAVTTSHDARLPYRRKGRRRRHGPPDARQAPGNYRRLPARSQLTGPGPDRVSLHPPPAQHLVRQHRRHHRLAKHEQGDGRGAAIPRPARPHLQLLWRRRARSPRPALPQCHANVRRPRVGPHRARHGRPDIPEPVPQRSEGRQHPPPPADAQHQD